MYRRRHIMSDWSTVDSDIRTIKVATNRRGNRSSKSSFRQHGAIGCSDRVDRIGFGSDIHDLIRSRRGTGGNLLVWNDKGLRIDLIVKHGLGEHAKRCAPEICRGQLCAVPAGRLIIVMVARNRQFLGHGGGCWGSYCCD
jgi:hypothetical protein